MLHITSLVARGRNYGLSLGTILGPVRPIKCEISDHCVCPYLSNVPTSYQSIDYRVPRSLEFALVAPSATYRKLLRPLGGGHAVTDSDLKLSLREQEGPSISDIMKLLILLHLLLDEDLGESAYIFNPEVYPSQRQLLYMLCDINEETIQSYIHSNDGKEVSCNVNSK